MHDRDGLGWSIADVADRPMDESGKARENGGDYAPNTARNAAAAIERHHAPRREL